MTSAAPTPTVLHAAEWLARESAHRDRADQLTRAHRDRASRGERHPVEDFLFTYYSYKPSVLRRWHPGAGIELTDAAATDRATWRWYHPGDAPGSLRVDEVGLRHDRADLLGRIIALLRATAGRQPGFGCFGMHEWAMVYRQREHRHPIPLRLGQHATDEVVERHDLRCTHFDAFRFFTPDAVPRNRSLLAREDQMRAEQPGCLHAGMDLYKWAVKLGPLVPGDLLLDAFELARDIRAIDMRASPYDVSAWGYAAIPVESPEGKAEYVRAQRGFAERSAVIRDRLIDVVGA